MLLLFLLRPGWQAKTCPHLRHERPILELPRQFGLFEVRFVVSTPKFCVWSRPKSRLLMLYSNAWDFLIVLCFPPLAVKGALLLLGVWVSF